MLPRHQPQADRRRPPSHTADRSTPAHRRHIICPCRWAPFSHLPSQAPAWRRRPSSSPPLQPRAPLPPLRPARRAGAGGQGERVSGAGCRAHERGRGAAGRKKTCAPPHPAEPCLLCISQARHDCGSLLRLHPHPTPPATTRAAPAAPQPTLLALGMTCGGARCQGVRPALSGGVRGRPRRNAQRCYKQVCRAAPQTSATNPPLPPPAQHPDPTTMRMGAHTPPAPAPTHLDRAKEGLQAALACLVLCRVDALHRLAHAVLRKALLSWQRTLCAGVGANDDRSGGSQHSRQRRARNQRGRLLTPRFRAGCLPPPGQPARESCGGAVTHPAAAACPVEPRRTAEECDQPLQVGRRPLDAAQLVGGRDLGLLEEGGGLLVRVGLRQGELGGVQLLKHLSRGRAAWGGRQWGRGVHARP